MKVTTHFPLDLHAIPLPASLKGKILHRILEDQRGREIAVRIGDQQVDAVIIEITKVYGGFDSTIEFFPTLEMLDTFIEATKAEAPK